MLCALFPQCGSVHVRVRRDADEQLVLAHVSNRLANLISVLTIHIFKDDWMRPSTFQILGDTSLFPKKGSSSPSGVTSPGRAPSPEAANHPSNNLSSVYRPQVTIAAASSLPPRPDLGMAPVGSGVNALSRTNLIPSMDHSTPVLQSSSSRTPASQLLLANSNFAIPPKTGGLNISLGSPAYSSTGATHSTVVGNSLPYSAPRLSSGVSQTASEAKDQNGKLH